VQLVGLYYKNYSSACVILGTVLENPTRMVTLVQILLELLITLSPTAYKRRSVKLFRAKATLMYLYL
jgi:hypothetical protein